MIGVSTGEPVQARQGGEDQLLYFMLKPQYALALEIDRLRRALVMESPYPLERFHITLQPFGDISAMSSDDFARIRSAADSLQADPFPIQLDRVRGNALVGSNARALRNFQRRLVQRLAAFGVLVPDYDFDPHLSLRYRDWRPRSTPVPPIGWQAQELLLVNSIHGKGHEVLGRWPLIARQPAFDF